MKGTKDKTVNQITQFVRKISQKNEDEVILDLKKNLYRHGINGCMGKSDVKKQ